MKKVKAVYKPPKTVGMRKAIKNIVDVKDAAMEFDNESEYRNFCQLARKMGFYAKSNKLPSGGWHVWISREK